MLKEETDEIKINEKYVYCIMLMNIVNVYQEFQLKINSKKKKILIVGNDKMRTNIEYLIL